MWTAPGAPLPRSSRSSRPRPEAQGALQGRFPGILYKELTPDQVRGSAAWNTYAGLSFWVKGDGSAHSGCLAIGPAGDKSWAQGVGSSADFQGRFRVCVCGGAALVRA